MSSILRRRLMMMQSGTQSVGGIFWFRGNSRNPVDLFADSYDYRDALTIEIVDTGEIIDATTTNRHIFNNTKENAVLIKFRSNLTSLRNLFFGCSNLSKFDDGVFKGLKNLTNVESLFQESFCSVTDEKIFEDNQNIKVFDRCFLATSIDILPKDKYGYLWDRKGVTGTLCFYSTPAADMFSDIIPYDWM